VFGVQRAAPSVTHWQLSQSANDLKHSALYRLSFFNNQEEVVKRFI
jgi:hypothetical protein